MKGLEEYKALEKLCEIATYNGGNDIEIRVSNYNSVILKALKELEERREMMRRFNEACVPMILDNETEKKLKALEIIRKMPLSFRIKIIEQANDLDGSVDLLKEVLL